MRRVIRLYRVSEKALVDRRILADMAGRPVFQANEIWKYIATVLVFPLARAIFQSRFKAPEIPNNSLAIGSRKRAIFRPVLDGEMPLDDLEYDWDRATWRFFDLRLAARFYLLLIPQLAFFCTLVWRKSLWSAVHWAVCLLEWCYLREIVRRHPQIDTVYAGYYIDRKAMLLALISEETGIRHIGLQHGAFNIFPNLHRAKVDQVILIYPFSRPFASEFFGITSEENVIVAPEQFELGWREHPSQKPFIVYGASADSTSLNREIVAALDRHLPSNFDILIKLHPRDSRDAYLNLAQDRVAFIDYNARNAAAYVGQLSSVIADAWTMDIPIAVMRGATQRSSDFQRMLDTKVFSDADDLAKATARMVSDTVGS